MADEEAPAAEEEEGGGNKGGGTTKMIIIVALAALLSGGAGVGVGFIVLGKHAAEPAEEGEEAGEHAAEEVAEEEAVKRAAPEDELHEDADAALGTIYGLQSFIVNINDNGRDRYLKIKAELELRTPEVAKELDSRLPQVRDLVIGLLGSKSFEEVRSMEGKNFLRQEMLHRINSLLVKGKARRVFFTEFVVQ